MSDECGMMNDEKAEAEEAGKPEVFETWTYMDDLPDSERGEDDDRWAREQAWRLRRALGDELFEALERREKKMERENKDHVIVPENSLVDRFMARCRSKKGEPPERAGEAQRMEEPPARRPPRLPKKGEGVNFDGAIYRVTSVKPNGKITLKFWGNL